MDRVGKFIGKKEETSSAAVAVRYPVNKRPLFYFNAKINNYFALN